VDGDGTRKFVYDGGNLLAELDNTNAIVATYDHGPLGLARQKRDTTIRYYHFDGLGSTVALTDVSEVVQDTYSFDAFGNLLSSTGSSTNPYRYVGQLGYHYDSVSGLMLLGARYYDAGVGRFITVDPAREGGNWYGYVENNSVNAVDPTGELVAQLVGGVVVYVAVSGALVGIPGLIEGNSVRTTHYRADLYAHCMGMCIGTACSFFVPGAWIAAWFKEWIDEPDDPDDWKANKIGRLYRQRP